MVANNNKTEDIQRLLIAMQDIGEEQAWWLKKDEKQLLSLLQNQAMAKKRRTTTLTTTTRMDGFCSCGSCCCQFWGR